jgi:hypothetical protein
LFQPGGAAPSNRRPDTFAMPRCRHLSSFLVVYVRFCLSACYRLRYFLPEMHAHGRAAAMVCRKNGQIEVNQRFFG